MKKLDISSKNLLKHKWIMHTLLNLKNIFILLIFTYSHFSFGQSITIDESSIGLIICDDDNYVGTGFVLNNNRQVVTCAHVIDTSHVFYYRPYRSSINGLERYKLKLIKLLPSYDLALLESENDLCKEPLINSVDFKFSPNQHLFYLGYNAHDSNLKQKFIQANSAIVSSVGKTFDRDITIDFVEFVGVGIPGYSGGPVINDNGKVIGVIREAWLKQGIKGGQVQLINRAYSILPIVNSN